MHAIDTPGSINGTFTEGNRGIGQRATQVGAPWLNDLQGNLLKLLSEAKIAPTKGRADDLLDAIKIIAAGVGGGGGSAGGVPSTRKISVAGGLLKTDGEDLSQDRTLSLAAATSAEIVAGVIDTKVITPKALSDAMSGNLGAGSVRIGPIVIKWGANIGNYAEGATFVPFPEAFAEGCFTAIPVIRNDDGSRFRDASAQLVGAPGKDGFTAMVQFSKDSSQTSVAGLQWIAVGR